MSTRISLFITILACGCFTAMVLWRSVVRPLLRKYRDWERVTLFALAICLLLVLGLSCWGAAHDPASEDHWLFNGIEVVFQIFDGDSDAFRAYASFCPILPQVLSLLVPLLTVFTALSLLWSFLPHHVPWGAKTWYIFSELDANSIRLAKSLEDQAGICIFLRTRRGKLDPELLLELQEINYFLYPRDETRFLFWRWRRSRRLRFFFLSENTDENFNRMRTFLAEVKQRKLFTPGAGPSDGAFRHELFLLSETESASMLIGHLRDMLNENGERHPVFRNTELWLLDRFRATSYDLLRKKPLYPFVQDGQLHVLVLGFGRIGREFFRAACSMGVIPNCRTLFTLCDLQIKQKLNTFLCQCPELERSVRFWSQELDADTDQLDELIRNERFHYIVIALGDDERNIRVTSRLKRYYRKCNWANAAVSHPQICVNIEDSVKHAYVKTLWAAKFHWDRPVFVFGGLDQAFTQEVLMPRKLWAAARWLHERLNPSLNREWSEYERRSSIACAAHVQYYLDVIGSPNLLSREEREKLIDLEHRRWMAYVRSEGMQRSEESWVRRYYPELGSHVDVDGLLSPCLVEPGQPLEAVQRLVDALCRDKPPRMSFRERDEFLLRLATTIQSYVDTGGPPIAPEP